MNRKLVQNHLFKTPDPVRVCYVVSFFHPFASGAERQCGPRVRNWSVADTWCMSSPRAVPGYPIDDEEYEGLFIHRWIKTASSGPLFGLSFLAGVIGACRLRPSWM